MPSKKTPSTRVAAIYVNCGACGEDMTGPYSGSMLWTREDCEDAVTAGAVMCHCGVLARPSGAIRSLAKAAL